MIKKIPKKPKFETPILFVHGAWHGAWCWKNYMDFFYEKGFSCYAFDLPCHGERRDESGIAGQSMMGYVKKVEAVAKRIGNPIIIGHSMGGFVTMKYLERNKPPAAVLIAPSPFRRLPIVTTIKMIFQYPLEILRLFLLIPTKIRSEKMYRHFFLHNAPKEVSEEGFKNTVRESSLALLGSSIPLIWLWPKKVTSPVLVLASAHDYFFPVRTEKRTAKAYKADLKIYEDMGHNLMTETGWDKVAADIFEWLKKKL